MKRLFVFLTTVLCLCAGNKATSQIIASGTTGDCTYMLTGAAGNDTLTIAGSGAMADYPDYSSSPWHPYCVDIKTIIIQQGVTVIGDYAFEDCVVASVTIPSSVLTIKMRAFAYTGLTSISIPNSVTSIGDYAFYYCQGLTSVTIGNSVSTIGEYVFGDCIVLASINVDQSNAYYSSDNGVLFDKNKTTLIRFPAGKTGSYTIPNTVTTIANEAFYSCSELTSVTIGSSVATIGYNAFGNCSGLTDIHVDVNNTTYSSDNGVAFNKSQDTLLRCPAAKAGTYTIPNTVTTIGEEAFAGCDNITAVTFGNAVVTIGYGAFYYCSSLTNINVNLGNSNYSSINGVLFNKLQDTLLLCPMGKTGSYIIPNSVTTIGENAFYNCDKLTSVTIGNSVTTIGHSAFFDCEGLTSLTIPTSVTTIGNGAFQSCYGLTSVIIPNSVTIIGYYAFCYCYNLTSLTIGYSVTTIENSAFEYCVNLAEIYVKAINPPALGYSVFSGVSTTIPVYVLCNKTAYENASEWNNFSNILNGVFPNITAQSSDNVMGSANVTQINTCLNNSTAIIAATANAGYRFVRWNDDNNDNPRTVIVTQDIVFTATFGLQGMYNVSVNANETGMGSVSGNGDYSANTTIAISATPNQGYGFVEWNDGNTNNPRNITVTQDTVFTAVFNYLPLAGVYTINVTQPTQNRNFNSFYDALNVLNQGGTSDTVIFNVTSGQIHNITANTNSTRLRLSDIGSSDKPVIFQKSGAGANPQLKFYDDTYNSPACFTLENAHYITFDGLEIENTDMGDNYYQYGISLYSASHITVKNCTVRLKPGNRTAFYANNSNYNVFENNNISQMQFGCVFEDYDDAGTNNTVKGNIFHELLAGIYSYHGDSLTIAGNYIYAEGGIVLEDGDKQKIFNNVIMCTGYGEGIIFNSGEVTDTVQIINNTVFTSNYGIENFSSLGKVELKNNIIVAENACIADWSGNNDFILPSSNHNVYGVNGGNFYVDNNISIATLAEYRSLFNDGRDITSYQEIPPFISTTSPYNFNIQTNMATMVESHGEPISWISTDIEGNLRNPSTPDIGAYEFAGTQYYTVTVTANNPSMGNLTGEGYYTGNTTITIGATPDAGYRFVQWNDGNKDNPRTVTVTQDTSFTAVFGADGLFQVSVFPNSTNMGSVTGSGDYAANTTISIGATAYTGYRFTQWNDSITDNPRTLTVTQDSIFTAEFEAIIYHVAVSANNANMGNVTGGGDYAYNTTISISATPNAGYHFVQWNDGNTDNPRRITVMKDTTFTATFAVSSQNTYHVTVSTNDANMGNVTGSGDYAANTTISIGAISNTGYRFVQWNDGNRDNPRSITVTQDTTFTARFEPETGIASRNTSIISVYPNPATDNITIVLPENAPHAVFTLYDMQGKVLIRQEVNSQEMVSINNLASGIYIYHVGTEKESYQGKIVKQ